MPHKARPSCSCAAARTSGHPLSFSLPIYSGLSQSTLRVEPLHDFTMHFMVRQKPRHRTEIGLVTMTEESGEAIVPTDRKQQWRQRIGLALLICSHIVLCCVSFRLSSYYQDSYILYDGTRLHCAVAAAAGFALVSPLFVFARFSFGYFVGFYFYTMILGYLWLNCFSQFNYDHTIAGASAVVSAIVFLLGALLITSPIRQLYVLSELAIKRLLTFILLFAAATAIVGAAYNFRFVSIENMSNLRKEVEFPTIVNYVMIATTSVLLPYSFACFLALKKPWQACAALLVSLSFYPILVSKLALFTPAWLVTLAILSKILDVRWTTVLSLLLPMLIGVILIVGVGEETRRFFYLVNFRMMTVPSSAMDVYNEFFARHDLTYFCQLRILKEFVACPYEHPLSIEMENNYALGAFNASLFATEGIASVGVLFAPVSILMCGFVIALGNRLSAGLPPRFILISGAVLPQVLLNVPLSTVLLTHGMGILFLLWYITPRTLGLPPAALGKSPMPSLR
jgi:hypothetical protein